MHSRPREITREHLFHRRASGGGRVALMIIAALLLSFATGGGVASAAEGSDGRAPDPRSELAAQFIHSLDRPATQAELDQRMEFVGTNCDWGTFGASYDLAISPEARNRWNNDPQNLAGMLYASLLDRAPDPQGLTDYTVAVRDRGLEWATVQMLGSKEYRERLSVICQGTDRKAGIYDWQTATDFADQLVHNAKNLAITCNVVEGVKHLVTFDFGGEDKDKPETRARLKNFITVTGEITNEVHGRLDGTCAAAVTLVKAAKEIVTVVDAGQGYNPVLIYTKTNKPLWGAGFITEFEIRVGPDPGHWNKFSGRAT